MIIAFLFGGFVGFVGMAIFSGRAYDKGFADASSSFKK
jgi:hypothetical protein